MVKKMKNEELNKCIHDLANKIAVIDFKLKKSLKLCEQEIVKIELEKANKNSDIVIELLNNLKKIVSEKNNE